MSGSARLLLPDLPTPRQEAWKYTDLDPLKEVAFVAATPAKVDIAAHVIPEARGSRLVFVNGLYHDHLSNTSALPPGVRFRPLSPSEAELNRESDTGVFASLNASHFQDGALVQIPAHTRVDAVLQVLHCATGGDMAAFPRLQVELEPGAELTLLEEYTGTGRYLTNAVVQIRLGEGAILHHERLQRESTEAFHVTTLFADVHGNARYESRTLTFGARLSRQEPTVTLLGEGATLALDGLSILSGNQHADTHSRIDHMAPRASSRQHQRTIVDGQARSVFNGRILVHRDAQGTDAQQQARTLLLSDGARVDAKPELEIFADDVKCAHGAAVGQLDPEEVFYLQSRGLDEEAARGVLTTGFASEVLSAVGIPSLRHALMQQGLKCTAG